MLGQTLNHGLCTEFEDGVSSEIADDAQAVWAGIFVPPIQARLNGRLPGANLSAIETIYMMDLCPFNTVANPNGTLSNFCDLFTEHEVSILSWLRLPELRLTPASGISTTTTRL